MSDRHTNVLFYVSLIVISLVNLIMIYALFSYFVLHQSPLQIRWLLAVFTTEIVGCFVLGWRKVVGGEHPPAGVEDRPADSDLVVVGRGPRALAIEKTKVREDAGDPDVIVKGEGVQLLVLARDNNLPRGLRKKYARRAIKIFARIPEGSAAYVGAQYNTATAYRTLSKFTKALCTYERVKELVAEGGARYTEDERREWAADIERMMGNVYFEQGLLPEAKAFYLRSWKLAPDNLIGMLNLFEVAVKLERVDEAQMWAEIMSTHEDYPSVSDLIDPKLK